MTELLLSIDMEGRHVINFVVENRFIIGDDLGKAM